MKEIIVNVDNYNENSIKTIEGDNLSEVYKIYICKNKRRVNLTNKIAVMAYVDEYSSKRSNILNLNITNAAEGEIELPITNVISRENGVYACEIAIYGENNFLEQTASFSLIVENNIFSKISNAAINSSDFHILSEAIKTTNTYGEKLKEGTENIELQYAYKLNEKLDKDGIVTMANMGQDVKEKFTGGSVAVVGKNAVLKENIVNGQVDEYKTSFLQVGKNIFDKSKKSPKGWWMNTNTGEPEQNQYTVNYCYSDLMPVLSSEAYTINKWVHSYCIYDVNYNFILGKITGENEKLIQTPPNGKYLCVTTGYDIVNSLQIELGTQSTEYEEYYIDFPKSKVAKDLSDYKKEVDIKVTSMQEVATKSYEGVEALNNTFKYECDESTSHYPKTNGLADYAYTSSTFSGWGTDIGCPQFVKSIKFKIRARNKAITKLKLALFYDNINGTQLYDELRTVNISPNSEGEIEIVLDHIITNHNKRPLFLVYLADSFIDMYGATSLLSSDIKPNFYYWTNGSLDFNSKTQVTSGGSFSTQVEINVNSIYYNLDEGIVKYSKVLTKEALDDSFILTNHFNKIYENGQGELDYYDRSTFSGWGSHLGDYENIKSLKFKVKNRDSKNTTKVKCWITEFNKDGEVLIEKTFYVNIKPNETETIIWTFNTPFNSEGKKLYLCYATDALTTLVATDMPFVGDNERAGWLSYTTNTNLGNLTPRAFSEVYGDSGTTKAIKIEVGEIKPTLDPTPTFIEKVSNSEPVPADSVRVVLPDVITCVVGDTLQLFYRGLVEAVNPYNYDIRIRCRRGKAFTRYFEFTPLVDDIGEYDFAIEVYNNAKILLDKAQCKLKVVNALNSPSSIKNILCIGDSLTSGGFWCIEAKRRLLESGGEPIGLNKTNINFIGTKRNQNCSFEGYGGWTWNSYLSKPNVLKEDIWVYCTHDKTTRDQHSIWQDANGAKWKLETIEPNRLKLTRYESHTNPIPAAPGILTHVQNAVNTNNISFTQCTVADANPFWDLETDRVDFKKYCQAHGFDKIDYVYTLLTWNGGRADMANIEDNKTVIEQAKTLIDFIHRDYPDAKIRIMGIPLPSLNGGTGANYGANGNYADMYGLIRGVFGLNLAYQEFANREGYKDFVEFINVSGQFDSENNMPAELVRVNTRSTKTELRGTNGVHPTMEGYYQIADVAYRQLVRDLLQNQ